VDHVSWSLGLFSKPPPRGRPNTRPGDQGVKLKGYYPYFGVQPFTFPSKYFATLQKGRGHFM